jgi:DNA repair exonuclease SbcCD ATPase subunit
VTRFFIPLIDVLILLFCIFLLMEFNSESEKGEQGEVISDQVESIDSLQAELSRRTKELQKFEELRPKLEEMDAILKELESLRKANQESLQQRTYFRVIDMERSDGSISYYDETSADQPIIKIADEKAARVLIERHQKEAKGREVYYYFMLPRKIGGFPTKGQIRQYKGWFSKVANSLSEK